MSSSATSRSALFANSAASNNETKESTETFIEIYNMMACQSYEIEHKKLTLPVYAAFKAGIDTKATDNPTLLSFAKAAFDLCMDDKVSHHIKRAYVTLNRAFLHQDVNVKDKECSDLIEKFTKDAAIFRSPQGSESIGVFILNTQETINKASIPELLKKTLVNFVNSIVQALVEVKNSLTIRI